MRTWGLLLFALLLTTASAFAQREITGRVVDEATDEPLIGASVLVEGTNTGTVTDIDGNYTIVASDGDNLVISYTGYESQTVAVNPGTTIINVTLSAGLLIDEVVVTGYTEQSRRNISGAVSSVDAEELQTLPSSNVAESLQGRAAGVQVTSSGAPGSPISLRIRGFGTINNNNPLYIIDGTPASASSLQDINPLDIENIQILKDASAASIYGARAANGVVIITTKKGSVAGGSKISLDMFYGVQTPGALPDVLNPQQLADVLWEAQRNAGLSPSHPQYGSGAQPTLPDYIIPTAGQAGSVDESTYDYETNAIARANKEGTDWLDEIFTSAPIMNVNVSGTGGNESGQYALSAGYFRQDGVLIHTGYERFTARANSLFRIKDRVRLGENLSVTYTENVGTPGGIQGEGNPIGNALRMPEIIPVYDVGGNYAGTRASGMNNPSNPVAQLERDAKDNVGKFYRILGNVFAEVDIIEGLTVKSSFNVNLAGTIDDRVYTPRNLEDSEPQANATFNQSAYSSLNWTWYNTLQYRRTLGSDHNISLLAGTEAINDFFTTFSAGRVRYFSDDVNFRVLNAGEDGISNSGFFSEWALFSIFGKVDYDYRGKYILSATVRRDGSSRFGEDNRYGVFPAFSVAWRVSDEPFLSGSTWLNDLKLRAGWGQTGNQEIGNYRVFSTFGSGLATSSYAIGGQQNSVVVGFEQNVFGNPNVQWETTTSLNVGFDAFLFNNRLGVEFDWYNRLTQDMLIEVPPSTLQGFAANPFVNVGEMKNTGIDLALNYYSPQNADFTYSIGLNISHYQNEVTKLNDPEQFFTGGGFRTFTASRTEQGRPIASFFGYTIDGIFLTQAEVDAHADQDGKAVGRWRFVDVDESGDINDSDRSFIGNPHPDFFYGANFQFGYKGFDLGLFFNGVQGNDLWNWNKYWTDFITIFQNSNKGVSLLNSFGMPGVDPESASLPSISQNAPALEVNPSTHYLEDGSFLRLRNATLGYSLPRTVLDRIGFERMRIYVQGNNVFTITNYSGFDPQIFNRNNNPYAGGADLGIGVDATQYPVVRSWQIGLNATF